MEQSSFPPGSIKVAVPKAVFWGWLTGSLGGAAAVIAYLIQLAFSLEADLVREQEHVGAIVHEMKETQDRLFSAEAKLDSLATRVAVLESEQRTR